MKIRSNPKNSFKVQKELSSIRQKQVESVEIIIFLPYGQKAYPVVECHVYSGFEVETEEIQMNNTVAIICSNMQNLKQMIQ